MKKSTFYQHVHSRTKVRRNFKTQATGTGQEKNSIAHHKITLTHDGSTQKKLSKNSTAGRSQKPTWS